MAFILGFLALLIGLSLYLWQVSDWNGWLVLGLDVVIVGIVLVVVGLANPSSSRAGSGDNRLDQRGHGPE